MGLLGGLGCTGEVALDARTDAIIGGSATLTSSAVVAVLAAGRVSCTATLLGPTVVLTAAHCLDGPSTEAIRVELEEELDEVPTHSRVTHPDWNRATAKNDIGLVFLDRPVALEVELATAATSPPTLGEELRFEGYGYSQPHGGGLYGYRLRGHATVSTIGESDFRYGVVTCRGDSGGPAFRVTEKGLEVVGVTSWGDPGCVSFGVDTRVDVYADWIREEIDAHLVLFPLPEEPPVEEVPDADEPIDGEADEVSSPPGGDEDDGDDAAPAGCTVAASSSSSPDGQVLFVLLVLAWWPHRAGCLTGIRRRRGITGQQPPESSPAGDRSRSRQHL